jgi:hypothetical protein
MGSRWIDAAAALVCTAVSAAGWAQLRSLMHMRMMV